MLTRLKEFENKAPHIVFHWRDSETEAEGWVVINSLRGGAAGGGTRMHPNCTMQEVLSLAKTMEVKFAVAGPAIGGAKSGIRFDHNDPRKPGVLRRWYTAVRPLLKSYYGTGGDLNVDEIKEAIPVTQSLGILHVQEGVVNGHFPVVEQQRVQIFQQLNDGVKQRITDMRFAPDTPDHSITVADMVTGFGVAEAVRLYYDIWHARAGAITKGKRVLVQGFGNVGGAAALELAKQGYLIAGIMDARGAVLSEQGMDLEAVKELYFAREGNNLPADKTIPYSELGDRAWTIGAEVFIPAASSRLVTREQVDLLKANGLEVISCGANVPFKDPDIFLGDTGLYADNTVSVIPDFIANCGMARAFAYFMQPDTDMSDEAIFRDTTATIEKAMRTTHKFSPNTTGIVQASFNWVLDTLKA